MKPNKRETRIGGDERQLTDDSGPAGRVVELEQRLRRRTRILTGALALSIGILCFDAFPIRRSDVPDVSIAALPNSESATSVPGTLESTGSWQDVDRLSMLSVGEDQIEAIALLYLDRQNGRGHDHQPSLGENDQATRINAHEENSIDGACPPLSAGAPRSGSLVKDPGRIPATKELLPYAAISPVNLRAAPSRSAEILKVLAEGDLVRRTGREIGWLQVEYSGRSENRIKGWVYSSRLRRIDRLNDAVSSLAARPVR